LIILSAANGSAVAVKIAVLDSGCNIEYEKGISFVDDNLDDLNGHGTAMAVIIREVNPNAKLYVAKVFNQNGRNLDTTPFVKAIHWAIYHRVDLINISWQIHRDEKAIHNALKQAHRQGIMVVASAGTKTGFLNALIDELSKRSKNRNVSTGIRYPAKYKEVIAVGAIDSPGGIGKHEDYSPIGKEIEFVCNGSYSSQKGTSFATARATAIISKIKADYPDLNNNQLRKILRLYTCDLGNKGRDDKFGYGELRYVPVETMKTPVSIDLAKITGN
jgi:minor extracellular protease Epr